MTMRYRTLSILAAVSVAFLVQPAVGEEQHCKLYPNGGLLSQSYELVGEAACKASCSQTNGCTAWSYTPHNFNPKNGPGECRLMAEVAEEVADARDYCGRM
ncbi:hypothetical protein [Acuticoccus kandeliae]|uniref:hypothetical protein n=1 Tax=Acuticoccus kandeliae TaxID=2073160 RepID=UPI001472DD61|nr:hypothetical protein [Acuticoccus kandeliae]